MLVLFKAIEVLTIQQSEVEVISLLAILVILLESLVLPLDSFIVKDTHLNQLKVVDLYSWEEVLLFAEWGHSFIDSGHCNFKVEDSH
jgi:hypothetical protein